MADASAAPADAAVLDTVLEVVRGLAEEVGGPRAARAVAPEASLEREVGLGSLERVELVLRLETALGRTLDERLIEADTPAQLARVAAEAPVSGVPARGSRPSAAPAPLAARAPDAETVHGS